MTHTLVHRARFTRWSPELETNRLRGFGWVAQCDCGQPFPVRKERAEAREDKAAHRCEPHT